MKTNKRLSKLEIEKIALEKKKKASEYNTKYIKENKKRYEIKFNNKKEIDLINILDSKENYTQYIKNLIMKDNNISILVQQVKITIENDAISEQELNDPVVSSYPNEKTLFDETKIKEKKYNCVLNKYYFLNQKGKKTIMGYSIVRL